MNKRRSPGRHSSGGFPSAARRIFFVCLGILLFSLSIAVIAYPIISSTHYEIKNTREEINYIHAVEKTESKVVMDALDTAQKYNAALAEGREPPVKYEDVLNLSGTGVMGYIVVPKLHLSLPIMHGTEADTLQTAVGHLSGTALPVGGTGTHCVLTGHSGLASQRLFSDLDTMEIGDVFYLDILGERFCYRVYDISVILPYELDALSAVPGKDYCTLVTCTPFGANTHRLLVRGTRDYSAEDVSADTAIDEQCTVETDSVASAVQSSWMRRYVVSLLLCVGVSFAIAAGIFIRRRY